MKNGQNPETHEILDELKPISPLEVQLDAGGWQRILDETIAGSTGQ